MLPAPVGTLMEDFVIKAYHESRSLLWCQPAVFVQKGSARTHIATLER